MGILLAGLPPPQPAAPQPAAPLPAPMAASTGGNISCFSQIAKVVQTFKSSPAPSLPPPVARAEDQVHSNTSV